jgi:hypothetical protein
MKNAAGTYGVGGPNGSGVVGQGGRRDPDTHDSTGQPIFSSFDTSIGVYGLGGIAHDPNAQLPADNGVGVRGIGGVGVWGSGSFGILGEGLVTGVSGSSPGISSQPGRGGVFSSGVEVSERPVLAGTFTQGGIAPIQLVPAVFDDTSVAPPATGQIGDLFVGVELRSSGPAVVGTTVKMYLCVQPNKGASAAKWAPFQLGPVVSGK